MVASHGRPPTLAEADACLDKREWDAKTTPVAHAVAEISVRYLLQQHGFPKMRQFLVKVKDTDTKEAFQAVYGFPLKELDTRWREYYVGERKE